MKAKPLRLIDRVYQPCRPEDATHLQLAMPCPISDRMIPVFTKGDRSNKPHWYWNGDINRPTITPSILTKIETSNGLIVCHSFIRDGIVDFLSDCTHDRAGTRAELLDID